MQYNPVPPCAINSVLKNVLICAVSTTVHTKMANTMAYASLLFAICCQLKTTFAYVYASLLKKTIGIENGNFFPTAGAAVPDEIWLRQYAQGAPVLICEDNPINQEVARSLLEDVGLHAVSVDNGEAGVREVQRGDFALVFRPWRMNYVPNAAGIAGIAAVVLIGNVLAFSCYMSGVKYIGPQKSSLFSFAEPVTAAIISTLVLGSSFTLWDALGFGCIFLMLVLLFISNEKQAKSAASA